MNILFAAGHLPASQGRQAGARHSYHVCEHLARRHRVHLLAFATRDELAHLRSEDMDLFASSQLVPVTDRERLTGILAAPQLPLQVAARTSRRYARLLRESLRSESVDVVVLDHTAMFQYASLFPDSIVTLGSAHDILAQSFERKASAAANPLLRYLLRCEQRRIRDWEQGAFEKLDYVMVLSQKDRDLVEHIQPAAKAIVVDLWMSPVECGDRGNRTSANLLFWGALDRAENADAARWAAREILPRIRQAVPETRLYIAGNRGEVLATEFSTRNDVIVTGFVDDVAAMMFNMDIALLPLRLGAGVKMKTLECMSAGLPVVTTEVGVEGIHGVSGVDYLVAAAADQLADHTIHLLRNREQARAIGNAGRQLLMANHSFSARMQQAETILIKAVSDRQRPAPSGSVRECGIQGSEDTVAHVLSSAGSGTRQSGRKQ